MQCLSIPYADDLLVTSGKAPRELEEELRCLLALKLVNSSNKCITHQLFGLYAG